ncbi:sugar phosphate isomerase/epimerase [Deinococcus sp. YIM 134068]|uniref:sugar phosphate isomerase/epimerase family protein n=1 Tax=Deinococcus lichenicola TaxID=3118910 RepID=UPI002F95CA38
MPPLPPLRLGMNARLFPNNWRPLAQEIEFASRVGFHGLQLPGPPGGLDEERLGAPLGEVARRMRHAGLEAVMEIALPLQPGGRTPAGQTPTDVLEANLPALLELGITHVHWHLFPGMAGPEGLQGLEAMLPGAFDLGTALARRHGLTLGFEHNAPGVGFLDGPEACRALLDLFPDLGLVFDLNHAAPDQLGGYLALAPRMTLLHVSDTPLPEVNWHLPLGWGSLDFGGLLGRLRRGGFRGPGVLEIGGQPWSGGYGQDTDEALSASLEVIRRVSVGSEAPQPTTPSF